ncbi:hypothetical protein HPB50_000852 [Hyalomma asiaticum]|uniref:Uncharacterized protein n=1 Tax=Hyalomma asiaticum TaxID=266040 RepID=A0ACB7RXH2_HYAAI|nr:hypothetical protein HPB50_000852 [Hyalomma asiaticum]
MRTSLFASLILHPISVISGAEKPRASLCLAQEDNFRRRYVRLVRDICLWLSSEEMQRRSRGAVQCIDLQRHQRTRRVSAFGYALYPPGRGGVYTTQLDAFVTLEKNEKRKEDGGGAAEQTQSAKPKQHRRKRRGAPPTTATLKRRSNGTPPFPGSFPDAIVDLVSSGRGEKRAPLTRRDGSCRLAAAQNQQEASTSK